MKLPAGVTVYIGGHEYTDEVPDELYSVPQPVVKQKSNGDKPA